jgi:putative hydrolase
MSVGVALDEDHHVHSTFSDDAESTLAQNVDSARRRGLRALCLADHVCRDSAWVPEFLCAVDALRPVPGLDVLAGVEAQVLDRAGRLDLPGDIGGADVVLIADRQFPGDLGPVHPRLMRDSIITGLITAGEAIDCLVDATAGALTMTAARLARRPQLAHLFSILPKIGLDEASVPDEAVGRLAEKARAAGAWLEVNEKWACPSPRTVRAFAEAGVDVVAGTGSHNCRDVGAYQWVRHSADNAFPGAVPPRPGSC